MWIGLKCKNTPDGLEGRHLICTESRGTRKIPQVIKQNILCHFKNWQQFCAYTASFNFSWLLVTTEFKLFPQKKNNNNNKTNNKTTKQMHQVVLCHLNLMGLQIKQCIFFANIFIHKPLQNVRAV